MIVKYPTWFKIDAKKIDDDETWELYYEEGFDDIDHEAFENAVKLVTGKWVGVNIELKERSVVLRYKGSRNRIINALATEFLFTSKIGEMPLSELFIRLAMG